MARHPTGAEEHLEHARRLIRSSRTAEELRAAQAILMPLLGYSLDETADVLGRSRHWVSRVRNSMMRGSAPPGRHGGRRVAMLTLDEELVLVRAAIEADNWFSQKKPLRTYLRDALSSKNGGPPAESTLTAILDRAAAHFLKNDRATGADLEKLATQLARIWFSQRYIADYAERFLG